MDESEGFVARPADLSRYEETVENSERREHAERQQAMEPPYAQMGASLQLDEETRQLLSESGTDAGDRLRGRSAEVEDIPALAKLEVRMDYSPGRQSMGWESVPSRRSGHSKDDLLTQRAEMDDRELVPDYSKLEPGAVPGGQTVEAGRLVFDIGAKVPEAAAGSQMTGGSLPVTVDMMMAQMSGMMSRLVNDQLAPTLNQMMLQQARVESRLEALELSSRPMSVAGETGQDRAIMDADEAIGRLSLDAGSTYVHTSSEQKPSVGVFPSHHQSAGPPKTMPVFNASSDKAQTGIPENVPPAGGASGPTEGVIEIAGVQHAWSIGAGGLQLQPLEQGAPEPKPSQAPITPGDVFTGRAGSPFERVGRTLASPLTEPRPLNRAGDLAGRALRATTSEPANVGHEDVTRVVEQEGIRGDAKGWIERNRRELEELLALHPSAPPPPPKDSRPVTPIRPRIVYPYSPGGTEIKPPPLPRNSPKRTYRSSPSPPRSPPGLTSAKDSALPEGTTSSGSELKQIADMLGEAIKGSRAHENRVEDVKAIPELPKLEIKDGERDLSPLIAGDWITMIGPSLKDLSANATAWWCEVLSVTQSFYQQWLSLGPMERLVLTPDRPERFASGTYTRVEQRAVSLLLKAVPGFVKEELVASRKLSSIEILCAVYTTYQPGGLKERSALLRFLTYPEAGKGVSDTLKGLRRWNRWYVRASELKVVIPDPTLLVAGLDALTAQELTQWPNVQFRCSTFRNTHNVDHVPTSLAVTSLAKFLTAEFQALESSGPNKKIKLSKAQENQESEGNPKGKEGKGKQKSGKGKTADGSSGSGNGGKGKGCYHWMTSEGCRLGATCRFRHDREALNSAPDIASRCYTCSGTGHRAHECTAPSTQSNEGSQTPASNPSKGKGGKGNGKGEAKGSVVKKVEEDKPSANSAQLLSAAGQLLDQLQVKALTEVIEINRVSATGCRTGLIDSGASNCLRPAVGDETAMLRKRIVDLAQGSVELFVTPCGTLVSAEPVEVIVSLGALIKLGCRMQWEDRQCTLWHPTRGRIKLDVITGCPRVEEALALDLIQDIETQRVESVGAAIKAIQAQDLDEGC